jgi:neutral ceramidase
MTSKIGYAFGDIDCELGTQLAGFNAIRPCNGIHRSLFARVLLIRNTSDYCFIQMDTICIDDDFFDLIADRLVKHGISKVNIIASATHTHSGPIGLKNTDSGIFRGLNGLFGTYDAKLANHYVDVIEELYLKASSSLEKFTFRTGSSSIDGVGSERHDASLPSDNRLFVMEFLTESNKKILYYNFPCHPTVLNGSSLVISSDLPSGVIDAYGDAYDMIMFINGSCGDISTRFTRTESTPYQITLFGQTIKEAIEKTISNQPYKPLNHLEFKPFEVKLKVKHFGSAEEAEATLQAAIDKHSEGVRNHLSKNELRLLFSVVEGASTNVAFCRNFSSVNEVTLHLTAITLNDLKFVTVPAELFSSLSTPLREKYGLVFNGYTNGYFMYIIDQAAFDKGYYEAFSTIFAPGQGEVLMDAIEKTMFLRNS